MLALAIPALAQVGSDVAVDPTDTNAEANARSNLLLVEIQTGSQTSASEEFVELYNRGDDSLELTGIKLQYRSAGGSDWLTRVNLSGAVLPRARFLISSYDDGANIKSSLSLAKDGGHLRLFRPANSDGEADSVLDQVAWGDAQYPAVPAMAAPAPAAGESLKRRLDEDGKFIDTDTDMADFILSQDPTPYGLLSPPVAPEDDESDDEPLPDDSATQNETSPTDEMDNTDDLAQPLVSYPQIDITELLVDPKPPQTDANDEFVELYNPNAGSVDLDGYVLQTGSKYNYSYPLPNITIAPKSYLAFYSADTGLVLANSGGSARLLNGLGEVVYEVPAYAKARAGESWALINGLWQWSAKPTPSEANTFIKPESKSRKKSSSGRGASSVSSRYRSSAGVLADTASGRSAYVAPPPAGNSESVDKSVVASVGSMALLYAMYEYRYDVRNRIEQLRRYYRRRRRRRS